MAAKERHEYKDRDQPSEYENREAAKEEALTACVAQHRALFECYKRGCWGFTRCCGEEHDAFWQCYIKERGVNKTKVGAAVGTWFEKLGFTGLGARARTREAQQRRNSEQAKPPDD